MLPKRHFHNYSCATIENKSLAHFIKTLSIRGSHKERVVSINPPPAALRTISICTAYYTIVRILIIVKVC